MIVKKLTVFALIAAMAALLGCGGRARFGSMRVRVLDGFSDLPIEGAVVIVPETGGSYITDARGSTEEMLLPVEADEVYERLLPSGIGRATLLVTAPGYTPCLLLYARVLPGVCREPEILLFPDDGSLPVFTMTESPDEDWCRRFAEKYGG